LPPPRLRTVVWSDLALAACARLHRDVRRLDDHLRAVEWAIATNPEVCAPIPGTPFRIVKTRIVPTRTSLRVAFTVDDDNTCTVHSVGRDPGTTDD
jgi:hypothetical protein